MQLAKKEQLAKFHPFLKTSIFWTLEATLTHQLALNLLLEFQAKLYAWLGMSEKIYLKRFNLISFTLDVSMPKTKMTCHFLS